MTATLSVAGWSGANETYDLTGDGQVDGRRLASELGHASAVRCLSRERKSFHAALRCVGGQAGSTSQHFSHLPAGPVSVSYLLGWPTPGCQSSQRPDLSMEQAAAVGAVGAVVLRDYGRSAMFGRTRVRAAYVCAATVRDRCQAPDRRPPCDGARRSLQGLLGRQCRLPRPLRGPRRSPAWRRARRGSASCRDPERSP
jgi:hypothetical protein